MARASCARGFGSGQCHPRVALCDDQIPVVTTLGYRIVRRREDPSCPPRIVTLAALPPPPAPAVTNPLSGVVVLRLSHVTFGAGVSHVAQRP